MNIKNIVLGILFWLKSVLGIKSPSKDTFCYRGFIPEISDGTIILKDALKKNDGKKYYARIDLPEKDLENLQKMRGELEHMFANNLAESLIKEQMQFEEFKQKVSDRIGAEIGGTIWWSYFPPNMYKLRWRGVINDKEYDFEYAISYENILMASNPFEVIVDGFIIAYKKAIEKEKDV